MQSRSELTLSTFYCLKADEIYNTLKEIEIPIFIKNYRLTLGEDMYRIGEYEKCIGYTKKGLANYADTSVETTYWRIRYLNTIGQAYKQLRLLDSAMNWYQQSMQVAYKLNETV